MSLVELYILRLKASFLTVGDIAKTTGYTRQHIHALARSGRIAGDRANPGGKHFRYVDNQKIRAWCEELSIKRTARAPSLTPRHRRSKRDHQAVMELDRILVSSEPVDHYDKEIAIGYWAAVRALFLEKSIGPLFPRPLLKGVVAAHRILFGLTMDIGSRAGFIDRINDAIRQLPVRPEQ